jgi:hypothetical protein
MARFRKIPRSPYWYISFFEYGKTYLVSTKIRHCGMEKPPPGCLVWKFLENTENRIAQSKWGVSEETLTTVNEVASEYISTLSITNSTWTAVEYTKEIKNFLSWCKTNGLTHMLDITPTIVNMWIRSFPDDMSNQNLKFKHGILLGMFRHAQQHYKITENPFKIAKIPRTRDPEKTLESF